MKPIKLLCWLLATVLTASCSTGRALAGPPPPDWIGGQPPTIEGCAILPADNIWNIPVDALPVSPRSVAYIASIGADSGLHADFGSGTWEGGPIGIPYCTVPGSQPLVPVSFYYADESDPGPYPIPPDAPIEGGVGSTGDRHVLVLDRDHCKLYELYDAHKQPDGSWPAPDWIGGLRPAGWTSADAAGLPILPGLVRYDEVRSGEIRHAIRFTAPRTQRLYVWPARHYASSSTDPNLPPMGPRSSRGLRADFDVSGYPTEAQVILTAMKKYGIILADNGSSWFVSGVPDERWDNGALHALRNVHGHDFEAVDSSSLMVDPDSARAACGLGAVFAPLILWASAGEGSIERLASTFTLAHCGACRLTDMPVVAIITSVLRCDN